MALGGGFFTAENKVLPGAYINFVSTKNIVNTFGERGVGAISMIMDWFPDDTVVELTRESIMRDCFKLFGYSYTDDALMGIRDFFKNGSKLYLYKGNSSTSKAASCKYCTAAYKGARGNDISIKIENDLNNKKLVSTYLDGRLVESQSVSSAAELKDNDFVKWKREEALENTTGLSLTGGDSGGLMGTDAEKFLNKMESYHFNAISIITDNEDYGLILLEYTKRMREEVGKKFQCITFDQLGHNYEGSISTNTWVLKDGKPTCDLLFWLTGAVAGCPVNQSLTNKLYDGEMKIEDNNFSQAVYEKRIEEGLLVLHKVGDEWRVLLDINTLTKTTEEKNEMFKDNQTIRVIDQIAEDIASIFVNYYLGKVPNDLAGRNSLWSDIVKHHEKLMDMRAIEDFSEENVVVEKGESKRSVVVYDCITPVNAMAQIYMKVTVE